MTVKNRSKVCLCISCAIIVIALVMTIFGAGVNLGIDFAGGMSMQFEMNQPYDEAAVKEILDGMDIGDYSINGQGANGAIIRIRTVGKGDADATTAASDAQGAFEEAMLAKYPDSGLTVNASYVGPVAGATLVRNAILSVLIAAALMLIYIAFRFDLNSGLAAVFGLLHDVLIMLSFMVLLRGVLQMNSSFIAAALTIVGYSINNTIVIFDRIRENAKKMPSGDRVEVVNRSVKECLGRTINTTLTTLVTITMLAVLGVASIREFAIPIIIGIIAGVYSANLINGYVWAWLENKKLAGKKK